MRQNGKVQHKRQKRQKMTGKDGDVVRPTVVQPAIRGIAQAMPSRPGLGSVGLLRHVTEDPT